MIESAPPKFGMGAPLRRLEDNDFITGAGRYTSDLIPEGALTAYIVRSTIAHGAFSIADTAAAKASPGVHLVWSAADMPGLKPMPVRGVGKSSDGQPIVKRGIPVLCSHKVRHVGDAIALIVAESKDAAQLAADCLEIDYHIDDAVIDTDKALDPVSPLVWEEAGSNLAFRYERGDRAAAEAAFARASKIATLRIVNNRLICNYMETRAVIADYSSVADAWTLTLGSQGVHDMRENIARSLGVSKTRLHVKTFDVGGGFGTKAFAYREYPLIAAAAKELGRPVVWVSDRSEHFLTDAHGRDNVAEASLALDDGGRILGMKVELIANMGAYLSQFGPFIPWLGVSMSTGLYDIQDFFVSVDGVYTNTAPVDAYRGAGRPEAAYLIERLIDKAAHVAGIGRDEIRRRNFIRPDQLPYLTPIGRNYDTGEFEAHMNKALELSGYAEFSDRSSEAKQRGKIRGFGFGSYVEACAFAGSELAKIILESDGTATLHIGTQSNGQGHKTAYAQFVAGHLGLDYDKITVAQGDTDDLDEGGGTGGSRSIPLGVPSVDLAARKLALQIREIAAEQLEAGLSDIELVDGAARIAGTDRSVSFSQLVSDATDSSELTAIGEIEQSEATYPNGTHVCEVEIDPDTGQTRIVNYTIVDDFGEVVNPLLLEGQVHGGVAQGIGQALLEHTVYDDTGQLLTATFNDYAMPRAADIPHIDFQTRNVPSKWNKFGIKGAGEAGSIGSCPAVMNAVVDALQREYGIDHVDMPATPFHIWRAISDARA